MDFQIKGVLNFALGCPTRGVSIPSGTLYHPALEKPVYALLEPFLWVLAKASG